MADAKDTRITKRIHTVNSLDEVVLRNNQVLCRSVRENIKTPTSAGVWKASEVLNKNQFLVQNASRILTVVKVPQKLTFWSKNNKTSGTALRWKTTLDIEEGDTVWTSYPSVIDYDVVVCGGEEYPLINYAEFRLAVKPNGDTVMLNGWQLYREYKEVRSSVLIDPSPTIDLTKGIFYLTGKKNTAYVVNDEKWVDLERDFTFEVGDVFVKKTQHDRLILEDHLFRFYADEDLYLILPKNIACIL